MGHRFWCSALLVGALAIGLPYLGNYSRRQRLPGCALDGVAIVPTYAVEIALAGQPAHRFCCIRCARYWLSEYRRTAGSESLASMSITVTDEVSAQPVDAGEAAFVRSAIVTNAITGNNIHVFADAVDAEQHAAQFRGKLLVDTERPFHEALN